MQNYKATILILDYMKGRQVVENVKTLNRQLTDFNFKIVVIDNSCNQENAKILSGLLSENNIDLIINNVNLGYTKAHNSVKHLIEGDYVFIVNPDIEWREKDALKKMISYMKENKEIGVLGPKQIEKNGQVAMTIRAFPKIYLQIARRTFLRKLPILKKKVEYDEMRHLDYGKTQDVDWLQSSCVVLKRSFWDKIGGLNEDYFLFMSDVEICYKAWEAGKRVVYYPEARVWADGKRVSDGGFAMFFKSWVLRQHVKDSIKYRIRHFCKKNPRKKYYLKNK
jgi:N-acetylglucosaminyl-diphospho-decaprenol L-rhamnosyltransferase